MIRRAPDRTHRCPPPVADPGVPVDPSRLGSRPKPSRRVADPVVMDTNAVTLYLGRPTFAVDPYTGFRTNQSEARLEAPAVLVIARPLGIHMIGTGS